MTLIFDERHKLQQGEPGLHALIVGVSAYPHLPKGGGRLARQNVGRLEQLDSAARTAYNIYCWLRERRKYLPVRLASIRLLVSPSTTEEKEIYAKEPRLRAKDAYCTWDNFLIAAYKWREDASSHKDNMTFFYFAGHGIETSRQGAALLLEDFANPDYRPTSNAVDLTNIHQGMAVSETLPNMARTQLYFVDACRNRLYQLEQFPVSEVSRVFHDILNKELDKRCAPIFHATFSGGFAQTNVGGQTIFGMALLKLLKDGYGGKKIDNSEDIQGQKKKWKWHISVDCLNRQLKNYEDDLKKADPEIDQVFTVDGSIDDKTTIIYLDKPPKTDLILNLDPPLAVNHTQVQIKNGKKTIPLAAPIVPHPYQLPVSYTGKYRITAQVDPAHSNFVFVGTSPKNLPHPLRQPSQSLRLIMTQS